jgi:mono/diheme cytochrome c family protein
MTCLLRRRFGARSAQLGESRVAPPLNRAVGDIRLAFVVVVGITLGAGGQGWSEDAAGDAGNGKRLYVTVGCYQCHGRVGQGGAFTGPAPVIAKTALPVEAFIAFIREPADNMPAYPASVLPDNGAADIYAYLQSVPGPRPVRDVPLLQD